MRLPFLQKNIEFGFISLAETQRFERENPRAHQRIGNEIARVAPAFQTHTHIDGKAFQGFRNAVRLRENKLTPVFHRLGFQKLPFAFENKLVRFLGDFFGIIAFKRKRRGQIGEV